MKPVGRLVMVTGLLSFLTAAFAFQQPANPRLPNFDNRAVAPVQGPDEKAAAIENLRRRLPNLSVDFHPITRSPKIILNRDGFLSGPGGSGVSGASLAGISATDPNRVIKGFLREHSKLFGHGPEALEQARIKREFVTAPNGMRTVVWEQQVDEVPVFDAVLIAHTTSKGELVNIASQFISNPQQAADRGAANRKALMAAPTVSAQGALTAAARNVGETAEVNLVNPLAAPSSAEKLEKFAATFVIGEAEAKLIWLPMDEQTLRLCWDVTFTSRQRGEMFRVLVDAETGLIQVRRCLTDYLSDATYRIFTSDSPSPLSPGYPTPVSTQPPLVSRSLVTLPALNTNASPLGWISDGGNETLGNNVDAHTDTNNDNLPDLPRPQGSPARTFDFAMDLTTQNPSAYSQAAVVQLFYWNNFMHDKLYELGFTEAAGNFQSNNFGRGGLGNDAVQADAQDGGGFNNANFSTPADGSPGRMQMYIFNGPTPQRDGDLDAEVVLHEYTHGLSNRRVGGGVGISALQPSGMGEGWSDFYGLSLLSEAGDDVNGVYAAGAYVTYLLSGMTQNYYFGIRRYPYCTDMSKNPLTFKDIDPSQASAHTGIPRSSIVGTTADEVHNMGEVWCVTLWEGRASLITKYGWAAGNQRMLQLVTDGMNLSPANPNFLQARDAIIQADLVDYGGADSPQLWAAFAKRGMGVSATSPSSSTTTGLVEAYDVPDDLQVTPTALSSSGPVGGPFSPNPAFFTLLNAGTNALNWSLASSGSWLSVSPTNGALAAGANTTVSVLVSASATNFPLGSTNSIIWFTNQTSSIAQARTFTLSVVGRTLFENFEPNIHLALWSAFGGTLGNYVIATNYGGSVSGVNSLWFGDAGTRSATTIPVNTSAGGSLSFYLRLGNGTAAPWETVDIPAEGIVLEYSTNSGASWTLMGTFDTATFYSWTQVTTSIPLGALSPATQFRWRQLSHSGTCCDHWALDDISIDAGPTPPSIVTQPVNQTVKSGSNVTFTVSAQGSFPLIYQWRKNGTNLLDGGRVSGAANVTLNIATALESDSGQYSVLITNVYGSVTSSTAVLLVTPLDHFEWSTIPTPRAVGVPFSTTITAKDFLNATVTNYGGVVSLSGSGGGPGEIYRASFEAGLQGLTITNTYGLGNGLWHLSTGRGGQTGHSASNSLYFGQGEGPSGGGNYNTGTAVEGIVVSPAIDLTTATGPLSLAFNCVIDSEPGTSWDHATLEVSTNNGVSYVTLASNNQGGNIFGTSSGGAWITVSNDFSAYAGRQVRLRLHFNTLDSGANNYEGWYVDDIVIAGTSTPLPVVPAISGSFTNGLWSGMMTVQAVASNAVLRADDGAGHTGLSNPFQVVLQDDLSIAIADSPDPVAVGANLTYTLSLANVGPSSSTSVVVTNVLPPGVTFISANSSQGSCVQSAGVVTCNLGTVAGGSNATVTIIVIPTGPGVLTNTATVTRAEADPYSANNSAVSLTTALMPSLTIGDASAVEGNSGQTNMVFGVQLSPASPLAVTVNYATGNGTALAGTDYVSTSGMLTFVPGETNHLIAVAVLGDTNSEGSETFFVNLSAPTNAILSRAQGVGTILDDDSITVAVYDNPLYVDTTSGGVSAESDNVQASLSNRNFRVVTFTNIIPATSANNVLLFPEFEVRSLALDLTVTERSALSSFVANGGLMIVHGQGPNAGSFINAVFGLAVVESSQSAGGTVYTRTAAATGTHFADDPASITGNNGQITLGLSSLPAGSLSIYENSGQSAVAEIPFGGGKIIYLGWDWYNAVPIGTQDGGWLAVLESAVLELGPTPLAMLTQPVSQTVKSGTNVTFTVTAQGSLPLIYQWRKDGTNLSNGGRISGATSAALAISTVLESDSGQYSVVITNSSGSVTSSNATLLVTPLDHFEWSAIPSPQAVGVPFGATITARDFLNATVTNFNGTVSLSGSAGGGQRTNTILAGPIYTSVSSGDFTLGYSITPNTNLTVTHVRHYSGTKVSIWTDAGVLLAAQNVISTPGTWTETPLATPIQLTAGVTYRVAAYSGNGSYYWRNDLAGTFPDGTINQSYEVSGDAFPGNIDSSRWWFVDLRYNVNSGAPVVFNPTSAGPFTNGIWTGMLTVQSPATNVVLRADEAGGHSGFSNPFDVLLQNDLAITSADSPDPVSVGANLTYTLTILNSGPSAATAVMLTNFLPANVTFVSAAASQGTYTQNAGVVIFDMGTVPGATNASASIVVVPTLSGVVLTNTAVISRAEPDPYLGDNVATALTTVVPPALSVADAALVEGNVGTTNMLFAVTLNVPSAQTITANYATANGSAFAGTDYTATNGVVTFAPGMTNQTVAVRVIGDVLIEGNETLFLNLSNPTNGVLARSQAIGTIINDDGFPGQIDHFVWQPISSPQMTNLPFAATITALDAANAIVTNFIGPVNLSASNAPITPTASGAFSNGVWSGVIAVQVFATNVVLRADDGDGHLGLSNPFHVIGSNQPPVIIASPTNTVAYLGGTAAFQANILGSAPLYYQWRFNGADIPGGTNSTLNLNHVTLAQAGNYSAVVWNSFGTNSTTKASLSVVQVVAWGAGTNNNGVNFNYNQSVVPSGITNAIQLSGGLYHSVAIRADGKVSAWGAGATNTQINPHYGQSVVPTLGSAVAGAGGGYHSLALRGDGTVAAWGAGLSNLGSAPQYGQCIVPSAATNIVAIAAGDYHSVALRNDGRVLVWGYNGFQQTNVPTAATSNVVAVASRASHVLALKSDGSLAHWGSLSSLPGAVSNIVTIAAGVNHCLALKRDGTVVSFGSQTTVPVGLSNVVDIAAGADHNLALRSDGTVVTWGATNLYGRYQIPPGLSNFVGIACGYYNSMAILGDGSPVIKWQPVSRSVLLTNPASFTVLGVGPKLGYRWQFNGVDIPGATNSTYTIPAAQALDAGNYQVILANSFGSVTSAVASLTVLAPIGSAVDAPNLSWSTSGNAAWFGQTAISHDGIDAAQSGRITDGQQSTLQTSVTGPGVLNFWWKVSSEQFFDYLTFFIDGVQQASLSGEADWQFQTFAIGAGTHTLKWTYQKDSSVSAGLDAGWLDQVQFTPNPPVITLQPVGQTNWMGATFSLTASASGAPPITYQWLKGGTNANGAVSSSFNIINATRRDSATYTVVASNPGGSTPSSNAVVLIHVPQRLNGVMQPDGTFGVLSRDADGGALTIEDFGKFESQASSNLFDWIPFTNNLVLTNGTLWFIDRDSTNFSRRFYRMIER